MSLFYSWSILIFTCLHFANIQATKWKVTIFLSQVHNREVDISLNNIQKKLNFKNKNEIKFQFELESTVKPNTLHVDVTQSYRATVQIEGHHEKYIVECQSACSRELKLEKWTQWNLEVIHSETNDKRRFPFEIKPHGEKYITIRKNSKTSNTSFFLPREMNTRSRIEIETTGKFWSNTVVNLKNMETSSIYSCMYTLNQSTYYHECSLTNNSTWRIELTSNSEQINSTEMTLNFHVPEREGYRHLTFKRLAYLPKFFAVTSYENISTGVVKVSFGDNIKSMDISKIAMTRILTGEEYGCFNINRTKSHLQYSCKVLKRKNWLLKVISSEKHKQKFVIEIFQGNLSSVSRNLTWNHFSEYGLNYIKHFSLKTYEVDEITSLKLSFFYKSLKINEISLINNFTEIKFRTNGGSKLQDDSVIEFIRITKGKEEKPSHMSRNMTIVIVLLAVIVFFLIIISIAFVARCKMTKNKNKQKGNTSTLKVSGEDNGCWNLPYASQESGCVLRNSEEIYANMNPSLKMPPRLHDSEGYWGL
ncbi:uncharacterized protein LOC115218043 isoform X2 [Octopus sinensis]|uniref:Uncharacterized protein LOC115218043 isoform X2 n=1 Tax=Octopus sinensis TaxID=2607531 RepID=A0A6P7T0X1_9MOLL|nr:uncharacterized protein LOC115218043 isoform X2 [Octopus sinensis]